MGPLFSEVIGPSTYNWIRGTTSSPAHLRDPWWSVVQFNGHPLHCLTKWVKKTIHVRFKMEATYNNPPHFSAHVGFWSDKKSDGPDVVNLTAPPCRRLLEKSIFLRWLQPRLNNRVLGVGRRWQGDTVDGSEIRRSPVDMANIPLFTGFYTSPVVVWDVFHQQYVLGSELFFGSLR